MDRERARAVILRRRTRFVAAALAGAAVASSCESEPKVCLEPGPNNAASSTSTGVGGAGGEGGNQGVGGA